MPKTAVKTTSVKSFSEGVEELHTLLLASLAADPKTAAAYKAKGPITSLYARTRGIAKRPATGQLTHEQQQTIVTLLGALMVARKILVCQQTDKSETALKTLAQVRDSVKTWDANIQGLKTELLRIIAQAFTLLAAN